MDQASVADSFCTVEGWAVHPGEDLRTLNTWVVLRDSATGRAWRANTTYRDREDVAATLAADGEADYTSCGFLSVFRPRGLSGTYRICIHYGNNGENVLIDTGQDIQL